MPMSTFHELMADAERGRYAVGYFEAWSMESLLAICDAAEAMRSPVILGWSGIFLTHPGRVVHEPPELYALLGRGACRHLTVPSCLLYNESPDFASVLQSVDQGYGMVMYSDESNAYEDQVQRTKTVVEYARQFDVAVEGEAATLAGVGGELQGLPGDLHLSCPKVAREFVERTGVDAFAVNIGQAHLHGRGEVTLDLRLLAELKTTLPVPLVLHGASSVSPEDLRRAAYAGIRKVNVGSILKRTYFEAMRAACTAAGDTYNPYEILGSGLANDVLVAGRRALQSKIEELMVLCGSVGRAPAGVPCTS